jgi:nicotinamide-nucleotide amidase
MFPPGILHAAEQILADARRSQLTIATAESCTGGLIAAAFTEIPGSSDVFERGFVTYSNEAKQTLLGIPGDLIATYGAVSAQTARAMAQGALAHAPVDLVVAVTGIAGPGGGSKTKPVGLVHFAAARRGGPLLEEVRRFGDIGRGPVRLASVETAIELLGRLL